jgi:hypothetical protein
METIKNSIMELYESFSTTPANNEYTFNIHNTLFDWKSDESDISKIYEDDMKLMDEDVLKLLGRTTKLSESDKYVITIYNIIFNQSKNNVQPLIIDQTVRNKFKMLADLHCGKPGAFKFYLASTLEDTKEVMYDVNNKVTIDETKAISNVLEPTICMLNLIGKCDYKFPCLRNSSKSTFSNKSYEKNDIKSFIQNDECVWCNSIVLRKGSFCYWKNNIASYENKNKKISSYNHIKTFVGKEVLQHNNWRNDSTEISLINTLVEESYESPSVVMNYEFSEQYVPLLVDNLTPYLVNEQVNTKACKFGDDCWYYKQGICLFVH